MPYMKSKIEEKYDALSTTWEAHYVAGGPENNPFMYDEMIVRQLFEACHFTGRIVSLGCGAGQDIEMAGFPEPERYEGYDISEGMLKNAREKFPRYRFYHHDCEELIDTKADILLSAFGVPNYIGAPRLIEHYQHMSCSAAFLVFYHESYDDKVIEEYSKYTKNDLEHIFKTYGATVQPLYDGANYYVVSWQEFGA